MGEGSSTGDDATGAPTPVAELELPLVSLMGGAGSARTSRRALADDGHWLVRTELGLMVVSYDEAQAVLRDRRWHGGTPLLARPGDEAFERWRAERQPSLLNLEGPDHQRLRSLLAPALTPSAVEHLRAPARAVVDELLAGSIGTSATDFVAAVAKPYPVRLVVELLGGPPEMADEFQALTERYGQAARDRDGDLEAIMAATTALDLFASSLIIAAADRGEGGVLIDLLAAEADQRLNRAELISLTETMLLAGTESTTAQLGSAIALFARFDEQFQLLRRRPELAVDAVEEVMRYMGAVRGTARVAAEDIDHRGVHFPAGTLVLLGFTVANRDRSRFSDPDAFDVTRAPDPPHLTLGHGIHYCAGAALARVELQEAVAAVAERVARIEVTGEIEWSPQTVDFWGPSVLPVTLHPAG